MLKQSSEREIEAPADSVGERDVREIDIINNLSPRYRALFLFFGPDKVPVRTLFAQTNGQLPSSAIEKSRIVRPRTFSSCTLHAKHGRALTRGNSTLRPGVLSPQKEA
jgi:hypothetical protein